MHYHASSFFPPMKRELEKQKGKEERKQDNCSTSLELFHKPIKISKDLLDRVWGYANLQTLLIHRWADSNLHTRRKNPRICLRYTDFCLHPMFYGVNLTDVKFKVLFSKKKLLVWLSWWWSLSHPPGKQNHLENWIHFSLSGLCPCSTSK